MDRYLRITATLVILVILTSCGAPPAAPLSVPTTMPTPVPTTTTANSKVLVVGMISSEPVKLLKRAQPLADYLAAELGKFGVGAGEVKIAPDPSTMAGWMKAGKVDLLFESPYPAMIVSDQANAQLVLRRWKNGIGEYHAVIFTRTDSGIHSLTDLSGHMIGLEEAFSTSGYLLPFTTLLKANLKPVKKPDPAYAVAPNEVGYVFTTKSGGDASNTLEWVLNKKVIAGAADHLFFSQIPEATRAKLTVLVETESIARQVVVAGPNMDSSLLQAIKALLLDMDKSPKGRTVLETFQQTTKFDELPSEDLTRIQALYKLAQGA